MTDADLWPEDVESMPTIEERMEAAERRLEDVLLLIQWLTEEYGINWDEEKVGGSA